MLSMMLPSELSTWPATRQLIQCFRVVRDLFGFSSVTAEYVSHLRQCRLQEGCKETATQRPSVISATRQQQYDREQTSHEDYFQGLLDFIENCLSEEERDIFFEETLLFICESALDVEHISLVERQKLFSLSTKTDVEVSLDSNVLVTILANAFLCTFPTTYSGINWNLCESYRNIDDPCQESTIRGILTYFNLLFHLNKTNLQQSMRTITVSKEIAPMEDLLQLDDWLSCDLPLCPIIVRVSGSMRDGLSDDAMYVTPVPGARRMSLKTSPEGNVNNVIAIMKALAAETELVHHNYEDGVILNELNKTLQVFSHNYSAIPDNDDSCRYGQTLFEEDNDGNIQRSLSDQDNRIVDFVDSLIHDATVESVVTASSQLYRVHRFTSVPGKGITRPTPQSSADRNVFGNLANSMVCEALGSAYNSLSHAISVDIFAEGCSDSIVEEALKEAPGLVEALSNSSSGESGTRRRIHVARYADDLVLNLIKEGTRNGQNVSVPTYHVISPGGESSAEFPPLSPVDRLLDDQKKDYLRELYFSSMGGDGDYHRSAPVMVFAENFVGMLMDDVTGNVEQKVCAVPFTDFAHRLSITVLSDSLDELLRVKDHQGVRPGGRKRGSSSVSFSDQSDFGADKLGNFAKRLSSDTVLRIEGALTMEARRRSSTKTTSSMYTCDSLLDGFIDENEEEEEEDMDSYAERLAQLICEDAVDVVCGRRYHSSRHSSCQMSLSDSVSLGSFLDDDTGRSNPSPHYLGDIEEECSSQDIPEHITRYSGDLIERIFNASGAYRTGHGSSTDLSSSAPLLQSPYCSDETIEDTGSVIRYAEMVSIDILADAIARTLQLTTRRPPSDSNVFQRTPSRSDSGARTSSSSNAPISPGLALHNSELIRFASGLCDEIVTSALMEVSSPFDDPVRPHPDQASMRRRLTRGHTFEYNPVLGNISIEYGEEKKQTVHVWTHDPDRPPDPLWFTYETISDFATFILDCAVEGVLRLCGLQPKQQTPPAASTAPVRPPVQQRHRSLTDTDHTHITSHSHQRSDLSLGDTSSTIVITRPPRRPIVTGCYECGRGVIDPQLQVVVQWLAASMSRVPHMVYYTQNDTRFNQFERLVETLSINNWTVGDLMTVLNNFSHLVLSGVNNPTHDNNTLFNEILSASNNY